MDAPRIFGLGPTAPTYGVGGLKHDRDRRGQQGQQSFEEAFGEEGQSEGQSAGQSASVAEDDTASSRAESPLSGGLQDAEGIIRKDEEDGQLHVDVVV